MNRLMRFLRKNDMVNTFFELKGNARACIWTEPLWGVPFNLYKPYITRYMVLLGLSMSQIGLVATISYISQVISSILSGVLTDKLGRRKCTLIFDLLSWSVPELIWAFSQNFTWFVVAALFNGLWKITDNSWNLLLVEDTPRRQIVPVFSLSSFMGVIATFVAPISMWAVARYSVIPTMRVLYFIAFASMTAKFIILYIYSTETTVGEKRLALTKDVSIFRSLYECKDVYLRIVREKRMLLTLGILAVYSLINTVNDNYWATFVVEYLGLQESDLSWFAMIRGGITLTAILVLVPRLRRMTYKRPMLLSIGLFALAQGLLLLLDFTGARSAALWCGVIACVGLEASAITLLTPLTSSLLFINADPEERARIYGMVYATISLMVCIFPSVIGKLADISLRIPFAINLGLFAAIALLTVMISRLPAPAELE
ncbi:MAG: MFS transporter [Christensenellales bacterium]|jgi:MFS family permease